MAKRPIVNIIILCFLICIVLYCVRRQEGFQGGGTVDIVVARYEEDLSWLKMFPEDFYSRIFIYNKGGEATYDLAKSEVIPLENVGREGHTYLTHIVRNYDSLAPLTFFLPGSTATNPEKMRRVQKLREYINTNRTSAILGYKDPQTILEANEFSLNEWVGNSPENARKNPESRIKSSEDRPLSKWFSSRFGGENIDCVSFLGIVVASQEDIRKRPREFYESLSEEMLHPHPETGHYVERVWKHILSIDDDKCLPV